MSQEERNSVCIYLLLFNLKFVDRTIELESLVIIQCSTTLVTSIGNDLGVKSGAG